MSEPDLVPGSVIRIPGTGSGQNRKKPHDCIVVGETSDGDIILVPICSTHSKCDRTCVITPRDTTIVEHESYAAYYEAKLKPKQSTIRQISTGELQRADSISPALLRRVIDGLKSSRETESFIISAFGRIVKSG
jgi:hypothetical protein